MKRIIRDREHLSKMPGNACVSKEKYTISTVAEQYGTVTVMRKSIGLKTDARGCERKVLPGAEPALSQFKVIQMKTSLQPLCGQGVQLMESLVSFLTRGYELVGLESGFCNKSAGDQLQADAILVRK
ncbi:hypothetical protein [Neolewinella agarilytica]|nr:hypothetical protein [Neolewinella agarilytica]